MKSKFETQSNNYIADRKLKQAEKQPYEKLQQDSKKDVWAMSVEKEMKDSEKLKNIRQKIKSFSESEVNPDTIEKKDEENQKDKKSPFVKGEIFDPEAELHKLRKAGDKKSLANFKNKLKYQKYGIAKIQEALLQAISKDSSLSVDQLRDIVKSMQADFSLSEKQQSIFENGLNQFLAKKEAIDNFLGKHGKEQDDFDGAKIYQELFDHTPKGRVEVRRLPISIYLAISDIEDFAYITSGSYHSDKHIDEHEIREASSYAGIKVYYEKNPGLKDLIICEKMEDQEINIATMRHEEQHVFNQLFEDLNVAGRRKPELDEKILNAARDEIIAYFKDGTSPENIHKVLLDRYSIYQYGRIYKKIEKNHSYSYLHKEYISYVERGIVAFQRLLENGLSIDRAILLLAHETLPKWQKIVDRLLSQKESEYETKKRSKLIGKNTILPKKPLAEIIKNYTTKSNNFLEDVKIRLSFIFKFGLTDGNKTYYNYKKLRSEILGTK